MGLVEEQSRQGSIDLFYGDETGVNELGYVPYAWQCKDEKLGISAACGKQINCFGLVTRSSQFSFQTSYGNVKAGFMVDFFESFSLSISKKTVVVLEYRYEGNSDPADDVAVNAIESYCGIQGIPGNGVRYFF